MFMSSYPEQYQFVPFC